MSISNNSIQSFLYQLHTTLMHLGVYTEFGERLENMVTRFEPTTVWSSLFVFLLINNHSFVFTNIAHTGGANFVKIGSQNWASPFNKRTSIYVLNKKNFVRQNFNLEINERQFIFKLNYNSKSIVFSK